MTRIARTCPPAPSPASSRPRGRARSRAVPVAAEGLEGRTLFAVPEVGLVATDSVAVESTSHDGVITVTRTGNPSLPLTVYFNPVSGTATPGVDYEPLPSSVTIPAGASWTNIPVRIRPDSAVEPDEGVILTLAPHRSYVIANGRSGAGVAIIDDYHLNPDPEPNEQFSDAYPLGQITADGYRNSILFIRRVGDLDHYRFTADAGNVPMAVMIEFNHTQGDLNLSAYNDRGREIARSTGTGDVERLVLPAAPGETFLLRVYGVNGASNVRYALDIRPVASGPSLHVGSTTLDGYITFPVLQPGQAAEATATLVNTGDQPLTLGQVELPDGYTLVDAPEATLEPGKSDTVTVGFSGAAAPGVYTSDATFNTNAPQGGRQAVRLVTPVAGVVARRFLYKNSAADANRLYGRFNPSAIDPEKAGVLPGEIPTIAHVSSYDRGINGVVLTLVRDNQKALSPDDFVVRASRDGAAWGPAPASLNVLANVRLGVYGNAYSTSDVTLVWPDYDPANPLPQDLAVANGWLEVTARANEHTGLKAPDVSYYGNLVGDVVDGGSAFAVNAIDLAAVKTRGNRFDPGSAARYDVNRDGVVNALDLAEVRANYGRRLAPPSPPPPAAAACLFATSPVHAESDQTLRSLLA